MFGMVTTISDDLTMCRDILKLICLFETVFTVNFSRRNDGWLLVAAERSAWQIMGSPVLLPAFLLLSRVLLLKSRQGLARGWEWGNLKNSFWNLYQGNGGAKWKVTNTECFRANYMVLAVLSVVLSVVFSGTTLLESLWYGVVFHFSLLAVQPDVLLLCCNTGCSAEMQM